MQSSKIDADMLNTFRKAQKYLRDTSPNFPTYACDEGGILIALLGFYYIRGYFVLDQPLYKGQSTIDPHSWSEDDSGKRVDLTLPQYQRGLKEKITEGVLIWNPGDVLYPKYQDGRKTLLAEVDLEFVFGSERLQYIYGNFPIKVLT